MAINNLRFKVCPSKIKVLFTPKEFYDTLISLYGNATFRAVLSSLYIGTGPYTSNVIQTLCSTLHSLPYGKLKVDVLIDRNRGSRPESKDNPANSISQVLPLLHWSTGNVRISLFHHPLLNWWLHSILPSRINELIGVMHIKAFISDNTLVISGANLNDSYLVDRQDRYIVIEDMELCNVIHSIVNCIQDLSYTLDRDGSIVWRGYIPEPLNDPSFLKKELYKALRKILIGFDQHSTNLSAEKKLPVSYRQQLTDLSDTSSQFKTNERMHTATLNPPSQFTPNPLVHNSTANNSPLTPTTSSPLLNLVEPPDRMTCTIDLCLQAGFTDPPMLDEMELICQMLEKAGNCNQSIVLASGYLNLPELYLNYLKTNMEHAPIHGSEKQHDHDAQLFLITAAPGANSFFQSKGPSYYIPAAYACVAQRSLDSINYRDTGRVTLFEYCREYWTFHSKGIWIYPSYSIPHTHYPDKLDLSEGAKSTSTGAECNLPIATIVGSSNYGERAVWRDLELSYLIQTEDQTLRKSLQSEITTLLPSCKKLNSQDLRKRYSFWLKWVIQIFGKWFL